MKFLEKYWLWIVVAIIAYLFLSKKTDSTLAASSLALPAATTPSNPSIPKVQSVPIETSTVLPSTFALPNITTSPSNQSIPIAQLPVQVPVVSLTPLGPAPSTTPSNPSIPIAQLPIQVPEPPPPTQTISNEALPATPKMASTTILMKAVSYLRSIGAKKFIDAQPIDSTYWINEGNKMRDLGFTNDQIKQSIVNFYS